MATLLTAERRQYILSLLAREGKVYAADLSQALGVSEDTIRRDLRELAEAGLLQRVHGGALPVTPASRSFEVRGTVGAAEKAAIGRAAAQMVRSGQILFMDAGHTTLAAAQSLPPDLQATVITNSPPLAVALASHPKVEVLVLGGRLYKEALATVGVNVMEAVGRIRADIFFLGLCSIHPTGVGSLDWEEAQVKRAMMQNAAEVVALAPPDRIGTTAPYLVAPVHDLTHLITLASVPDEQVEPYRAAGVTVLRV